jgi:GMP synthase (glutamine-hydrolysing)
MLIAILVTGDPVPLAHQAGGDFARMIIAASGRGDVDWQVIKVHQGEVPPEPRRFDGIIVSGSPSSVTERSDWILATESYLRLARGQARGLLGLCFGHQIMASAFGGTVIKNPKGIEMGTTLATSVGRCDDLPWPPGTFDVQMCHGDTVVLAPPGAHVLATSARDAHAALRYGPLCLSTQFHPEFSPAIMTAYLHHYRRELGAQNDDVDSLICSVRACEESCSLLGRFVDLLSRR